MYEGRDLELRIYGVNQNGRSKTPNSTATEQILRSKTPDPRYSQPQPQQVASVNKQTENYYFSESYRRFARSLT